MALLLVGTLIGLLSYHWTMKSIGSKLGELNAAETLKQTVARLASLDATQEDEIAQWIAKGRQDLEAYELRLIDTLSRGRDRNEGHDEKQLIDALHERFDRLAAEIDKQPVGESRSTDSEDGEL